MAEYFDRLDRAGMPMNVVQTVGHTQVRAIVIGDVDRQATPDELERMKGLVREAMEAGAIGLSTSLDLSAGRLRLDRGDHRARPGRRRVRRPVLHPHAERGRPAARGDRRGARDRPGRGHARAHLPPQGGRPGELAQDGAGHRPDQGRARRRARSSGPTSTLTSTTAWGSRP